MNNTVLKSITLLATLTLTSSAWSWGGRGHHTICESAVFLVKHKALKEFLQLKPQVMGHLCNIPDTYWKSLGPDVGKWGNSTHYFEPDIIGLKAKDTPTDYKQVIAKYTGAKNTFKGGSVFSIPMEVGSNWWRADQFYRRAISAAQNLKSASAPANPKEEQDDHLPYNQAVYDFFVNLGLMGHFVGDNSQPYHSTGDYDGWEIGHGGIHSFYEEAVVAALPYTLTSKVVEEGMNLQKMATSKNKEEHKLVPFLTEKTVIEKMRALANVALEDLQEINKLDPIKKPSVQKDEKGMLLRTRAEREPAETAVEKFQPIILRGMARSATLLAQLWDMAYEKAGTPKLEAYKSYRYPFTPDFVPPDYFDQKELDKKNN